MAHRAGKKTARISRKPRPKKRGVKLFAGQKVNKGGVIVRQCGSKFLPGLNVKMGKDYTLYAVKQGKVQFKTKRLLGFDGRKKIKKIVNVI